MIKKTMIATLISVCLFSSAYAKADGIANSTITIQDDSSLSISTEITTDSTDAILFTAMYFEGKLMKIQSYKVSENQTINEKLICEKTPDEIKTFLWQSNLKPLSAKNNVLTESVLLNSNKKIVSAIQSALDEIDTTVWIGKEEQIMQMVTDCSTKAVSLNTKYLLTSEFAQRHFENDLKDIKAIYDTMTSNEKSNFQGRILDMDIETTSYIIDYFGLKKLL